MRLWSTGKPSDHSLALMKPISVQNNKSCRTIKEITYRPITDIGLQQMQDWFQKERLPESSQDMDVHELASSLMASLQAKTNEFSPIITIKISSDSQPYFSNKLASLRRKKFREYHRHRRSKKRQILDLEYKNKLHSAKKFFYIKKG